MFGDVDWPIVKEVWVVKVDSCIELLCEVRVSLRSCSQVRISVI